jgi:hypothetical protein
VDNETHQIALATTGDPFTDTVLAAVPESVRESFTEEQTEALRTALEQVHDSARHLVDVRAVVPLYFLRFYAVFLLGKDQRNKAQEVLLIRRRKARSPLRS